MTSTTGQAGSLVSCDALVSIVLASPGAGVSVEVEGANAARYLPRIREVVREVLNGCGLSDARVKIADRGALDFVIRARVATAAARVLEQTRGDGS